MKSGYLLDITNEIEMWKSKIYKKNSLFSRSAKHLQNKINSKIPENYHAKISGIIKNFCEACLSGSKYISNEKLEPNRTIEQADKLLNDKLSYYKKIAVAEGAGTGAAGLLIGLADFPLLLGLKLKFMYDIAIIYGYDVNQLKERQFLLHIFLLTYSSSETKISLLKKIDRWDELTESERTIDWDIFQKEYRDSIDLIKMLQLVPGIGAAVGAYANYTLLEKLGETSKNCYRIRKLNEKSKQL
ncbi:MAG: transporter-associated protein EcsC [Bacillales bacterium]|nr:transporter-associated protein EcsC [Bacillales bacterium]